MGAERYYFYISDSKLKEILNELKKNRLLSDILEEVLSNGLEKQIKKRLKELEKLGDLYKK